LAGQGGWNVQSLRRFRLIAFDNGAGIGGVATFSVSL
jgi:hypothetical protein